LLLEGWYLIDACREAERLRIAIQKTEVQLPSSTIVSVTVSLGVAEHAAGQSVDHLLKNADVVLSAAKTVGRNRTVAYGVDDQLRIDDVGDLTFIHRRWRRTQADALASGGLSQDV
jgi:predicted signal transduction protein with EAL and GGDEF domain